MSGGNAKALAASLVREEVGLGEGKLLSDPGANELRLFAV